MQPAIVSPRWADLRLRLASALVLGPLALACAWFGGWAWFLLVALAAIGVCWEWASICPNHLGAQLGGFACTMLAVAALGWLRADAADGRAALFFLLVVVWSSDVGAYLAGRTIGGRKLAPAISPGKTWSGAVGGLLTAMLGGVVVAALFGGGSLILAGLAAAVLGVASQAGDLAESAIKRRFGVKDSGRLIPGHGGLLDRLDGLMAAALVASGWALATGQGGAMWR